MNNAKVLNYWVIGGFDGAVDTNEAIDLCSQWNLDGIELTFGDLLPEQIDQAACNQIRKHAGARGIGLHTLATGKYWEASLGSPDQSERQRAIEFTKRYIEVAALLGVPRVLIVAGAVDVGWDQSRPVVPYQAVWDFATESIRSVEGYASDLGVQLCLENVWSKFLLSAVEFRQFLGQFDSSSVGAYFDIGNVVAWGYPEHWITVLNELVLAVHVKNFRRSDSLGVLHGFSDSLKDGDVNYAAVIDALVEIDYQGPITAEMIPFCRLPDLNLPDLPLAERTAQELLELFA